MMNGKHKIIAHMNFSRANILKTDGKSVQDHELHILWLSTMKSGCVANMAVTPLHETLGEELVKPEDCLKVLKEVLIPENEILKR